MSGYGILLHPHAEATDVIINMGSSHKTAMPMFETQGNWGDNYGNPPSAPRYLECRLNDIARKLYFSLIDQAPFENFEVEEEPLYLPTLFLLSILFLLLQLDLHYFLYIQMEIQQLIYR